jgi:hypothetical protein
MVLATEFTPPQLLNMAIIKKSDVAVIERLSVLAERWQERIDKVVAYKAFVGALVAAKLEMPILEKNRHVQFKSTKGGADVDYWHEDLAMVVETAQPVLARHGLSFRWKLEQPAEGKVKVTCILEHIGGHFTENDLSAGVDLSGQKNHIQAIKSASTYLERITALAAVGLAARGHDDDGIAGGVKQDNGPKEPVITDEQGREIMRLLVQKGRPLDKFLAWAQPGITELEELHAVYYDEVVDALKKLDDVEP